MSLSDETVAASFAQSVGGKTSNAVITGDMITVFDV